jgi:hypothetical protein
MEAKMFDRTAIILFALGGVSAAILLYVFWPELCEFFLL